MILVDKRLPNAYNLLFSGYLDEVDDTRIEQYYKDFTHVKVVPYWVVRERTMKHRSSEDVFGDHLVSYFSSNDKVDYDKYPSALGSGKTADYRKVVKMHWLINDIKDNGINDPITAVLFPAIHDKIEWNVSIHPGSFRQHAVCIAEEDIDVVIFDAFELFWDYPKCEIQDVFDAYHVLEKVDITMIHHENNLMTPQMLNITDKSRHSQMGQNTQAWEKKIRHMFDKPVNIFIGYDSTHGDASEVCKNSILRKLGCETNINIQMLDVSKIEGWTREYKNQSTEFSYSRFLVPYLSNYEGISIFCDDDFIFTENILNTIWFLKPDQAVACVKHDFTHKYDTKFTNTKDVWYNKKLWSSLMVFNNSHPDCKNLTLESVQKESGQYLHQFEWTSAPIGEIPYKWNWCEGYSDVAAFHDACGIHWTRGGPWIEGMDCIDIHGIEIWNWFKYKDEPNWKKAILDMSEYYDINWTEDDTGTEKVCAEINRDVR